ncbi:MAG: zinc ABC transporter substrate-binding protein [Planctomycetes bacterium]|nr:zinc ABC transporter substrate-binding protein [Planctomycetota bacterium]
MKRVMCVGLAAAMLSGCERPNAGAGPPPAAANTSGSGAGQVAAAKRAMRVVVTIAPLKGLVAELAPAGTEITMLMQPGRSEHGYEFTPADIQTISQADAVVYVGLGLEPTVAAFVEKRVSATREAMSLGRILKLEEGAKPHEHKPDEPGHSHGGNELGHDGHHHGPIDVHVWLDPVLMKEAVPGLNEMLMTAMKRCGATSAEIEAQKGKGAALVEKLAALDGEIKEALKPFAGRSIVTHHAAFGRLAERYGLKVAEVLRPIETSEPTPAQMAAVAEAIRKEGIKTIFIEPQFDATAAKRVAELAGVQVMTLDPLGRGDYFALLRENVDALVKGFAASGNSR